MFDNEKYYAPCEIADLLGVTHRTVLVWLREKKLKGLKLSANMWRISSESLRVFLTPKNNKRQ